jgi:hypothetical protein
MWQPESLSLWVDDSGVRTIVISKAWRPIESIVGELTALLTPTPRFAAATLVAISSILPFSIVSKAQSPGVNGGVSIHVWMQLVAVSGFG